MLGKSEKFFFYFQQLFPGANISVISWRKLTVTINEVELLQIKSPDLVVLCGYDYKSGGYDYSKYIASNIESPLEFIEKIASPETLILYADTGASQKEITYSRYRYAKNQLAIRLLKFGGRYRRISLPVLIGDDGRASVYGSLFSKYFFNILIYAKIIETTNPSQVRLLIKNALNTERLDVPRRIEGKLLNIKRTVFIDRFLRLIYG